MNWIKFCIFMSPVGLLLFALTYVQIDIFTYKDTNKLERVVLSAKEGNLAETYPVYPEGLCKDSRLDHKEGLTGLGTFGIDKIKDHLQAKEEEGDEKKGFFNQQQVSIPPRPHSVGKFPTPDENEVAQSKETLSVPESIEVNGNKSVGTSAVGDSMMKDYNPEVGVKRITRVFSDPNLILTGSFCVDPLCPHHLDHTEFLDDFLSVVAQFDLLAVQGIYADNADILEKIVKDVSIRTGRSYRYTVVFPTNSSANRPVPVFFYDENVLEVDPSTIQLIGMPNQPFSFPPLSAKYRVKKAPAEKAFTFYAVNLQLYPGFEKEELNSVPNMVMRLKETAVQGDFDREDDVIMFGYFGLEPRQTIVGDARFNETVSWANPDYPTNTFGTFSYVAENILFESRPLAEYENKSGIWDLRKQFHRPEKIPFDHHPVWSCFNILEGGAK